MVVVLVILRRSASSLNGCTLLTHIILLFEDITEAAFDAAADPIIPGPELLADDDAMDTVLQWIGFENIGSCERLRNEGLSTFGELKTMKEKDIRDLLAESYGGGRQVHFWLAAYPLPAIRYLLGLIHWVQDFHRPCLSRTNT